MTVKCTKVGLLFGLGDSKLCKSMNSGAESSALEQPAQGEFIFPLRKLSRAVWRRLWVVVLVAVLFCGTAIGWNLMQVPMYQASARILIGQGNGLTTDPMYAQSLQDVTLTMTEAAASRPVAEDAVERLDSDLTPKAVLKGLSAQQVPDTQFIELSYSNPDPEVARKVVNTVADAFSERMSNLGPEAISATVWQKAQTPTAPVNSSPLLYGFAALVLGVFVSLALVLLLEYLDNSLGSPQEAEHVSGVPNLGAIPEFVTYSSGRKRKRS